MKYKRQGQILRIIHEKNIKTHEQLIGELNKCGYNVTQATVSRDIKELGLIKIPLPDGGSVYSSSKDIPEELDRRINMITDTVISVDFLSPDGNERNMAASFNFEPETGKYLSIYRKASGTKPGSDDRYEDGAVAKAYPEIAEKLIQLFQ